MTSVEAIAQHYRVDNLLQTIANAVGKARPDLTIEDLAPVDEFHIGGSAATRSFLDGLVLEAEDHALDIGCGLGGTSRFAATTYGCRVTGVDLTSEYVETGRELCNWLGLQGRVALVQGNALAMDFPGGQFDKAFSLHVGMNIPDKRALMAEAWRVLKPGGVLGIYDVMRMSEGELTFPVPWATHADSSFVAGPDEYKTALHEAGFELMSEHDRSSVATRFFRDLAKATAVRHAPSALGLHVLMGTDAPAKVRNMVHHVAAGTLAPVELIARKPH